MPQTPCYIAPGLNRKVAEAVDFPQIFSKPGHGLVSLSAGAWRKGSEKKIIYQSFHFLDKKFGGIKNYPYICSRI